MSLKSKGVVNAFIQSGVNNPWLSSFTTSNFDVQQEGSISHVFAINLSTPSYIEISKTAKYRVDLNYCHYISFIGGINTFYYIYFYNKTDNIILGQSSVAFNNQNSSICQNCSISGVYLLESGKTYDVRLVSPQNVINFTQVYNLNLNIVEFISLYS